MKFFTLTLSIITLFSCTNESSKKNQASRFYPEQESLYKVLDPVDSNSYFYFPNDSVVLRYKLRRWKYTSPEGKAKTGADFHANKVYLKEEEMYVDVGYLKTSTVDIQLFKSDSSVRIKLVDQRTKYTVDYNLAKVDDYNNLPKNPKKSWRNYYNRFYTDTLERFTPQDNTFLLIAFSRGTAIDTVELSPFEGVVSGNLSENDTLLIDMKSDLLYVIPKTYIIKNKEVISEQGSFKVFSSLNESANTSN